MVLMTSMRKTIARRMVESFRTAPHFYLTIEVDTSQLEKARQELAPAIENEVGTRLTYTDLLTQVVARALEECPEMNCSFNENGVKVFSRIDIGLVAAVPQIVVVNSQLRNVPESAFYNWEPGSYFGIYRPDTFWFGD